MVGPDNGDDEWLGESAGHGVRVARRELAPLAILADEPAKGADRDLAPFTVAGEVRQTKQPVGSQGVLLDRPLAARKASRLYGLTLGRVKESAGFTILKTVSERHRHSLRSTECPRMDTGLVCVEIRGEVRGHVSKQVEDLRVVPIEVTKALGLCVPEPAGHCAHRVVRSRVERVVAECGPRRPVRGGRERVPADIGGAVYEGSIVLGALGDRIERVVVLVGVLRPRPEVLVRLPQDSVHPADHIAHHAVISGRRERAVCLRVDREELGVVFEHLLVVRDPPLTCRRVAEEATFNVVVHAAGGHRAERPVEHRRDLGVPETAVLVEKEPEQLGLRELGLASEPSELRVVLPAHQRTDLIDDLDAEISGFRCPRLVLFLAELGDTLREVRAL